VSTADNTCLEYFGSTAIRTEFSALSYRPRPVWDGVTLAAMSIRAGGGSFGRKCRLFRLFLVSIWFTTERAGGGVHGWEIVLVSGQDPRPHYALPPSLPSLAHTCANARGDASLHIPRTQRVQPKLRSGSFKRRHPHLVPSFEALQSKSMVNLAVTTSPSSPDISDPETGSPSPLSPRGPLSPESHSPQLYRPHFLFFSSLRFLQS
jgi:hypothetical protein